ncbi:MULTISPECIES: hypothetical protein [Acinetobacter]|uniref:Uncharacterized protein n=1 Tax=Acinetobacter pittii TaxID=48296 RepID=A0A8I1L0M5_ACIPI|nr:MULTISPECIES: hypothetical protein [Acinetobacter]MDC5166957.1 hypothetical protein [Acinetobacter baumannii]MBK1446836.1 hypothetical protein [Acinetobacter pittii]MCJ9043470.1 hypothetical protein [Acinetobacter pittii]MDC5363696.1 hypothetical protein [Acinetobacter baumannii]USA55682.1 hypothetical protein NDN13_19775 [Acinetobacter sp. C32I]
MENSSSNDKPTVYGSIGLAVFLIFFGISYLIPNIFPEGSMFVVAGSIILLVNLIKLLKNIGWDGFEVLFGIAFLVSGLNKVLKLEVSFIPVIIIVLALFYLFKSIKELKK